MQASYTYSRYDADAEELDLLEGDERSRIEKRPGYQSTDQRHLLEASAVRLSLPACGFQVALEDLDEVSGAR